MYNDENVVVESYDSYNLFQSKWKLNGNQFFNSEERIEGIGTYNTPENMDAVMTDHLKASSGKVKLVFAFFRMERWRIWQSAGQKQSEKP